MVGPNDKKKKNESAIFHILTRKKNACKLFYHEESIYEISKS